MGNSGRYDHFRYLSVLYIPFREATPMCASISFRTSITTKSCSMPLPEEIVSPSWLGWIDMIFHAWAHMRTRRQIRECRELHLL